MLGLKKFYLLLFVAAISGIAAWWYRASAGLGNLPPEQNAVPAVRRDFTSTVLATGSVQAQVGAEVRVGARVSGKVNRLYANIGDVVRRGDLIAELEKEDGLLVWSIDVNSPGSKDITEVLVDAKTGKVVSVETESPDSEKQERDAEHHDNAKEADD